MLEALGWIATAVFSTSYCFQRQTALRLVQAAAACLWITYGLAIGARPVVVANLIVAVAAVYTSFRKKGRVSGTGSAAPASGEPGRTGLPSKFGVRA
jgi:hypothetical protein